MILTKPQERTRFLRFAFVGIIGAVIDFGVFNLLTRLTPIEAVWASTISFVAAVISNFIWNRYWTYPDSRSKPLASQVGQFFVVSIIGMGMRILMFKFLEELFINTSAAILPENFFLTPTFVGHNFLLAVAILLVMLWNFIANRYWTYNDVK
jgi:putative flippase GtrA